MLLALIWGRPGFHASNAASISIAFWKRSEGWKRSAFAMIPSNPSFASAFSSDAGRNGFSKGLCANFLGQILNEIYNALAMTRPQVEFCIKIFIVLLIVAFALALRHVLLTLGWA